MKNQIIRTATTTILATTTISAKGGFLGMIKTTTILTGYKRAKHYTDEAKFNKAVSNYSK